MADTPKEAAREGSLDAPLRHPIAWRDEAYYDLAAVEKEMERVFDICHGCRRCFNLCDSFPKLFDMIDESPTGELDGVDKARYAEVAESCTLCDMCFLTKCPYVPPHAFDLDFPHLILRYRAAVRKAEGGEFVREQLGETDRNGKLAKPVAGLANWATKQGSPLRGFMEAIAGIDAEAKLPVFHSRTATDRLRRGVTADAAGPAFGQRKAAVYATCFSEYNAPSVAEAAMAVLARQGVAAHLVYPECCGMPQMEAGDLKDVAGRAARVAKAFQPALDDGCDVVALTASCALMLKFEWPLLLPENADVQRLAKAVRDVSEYVVELSKAHGLAEGLGPVDGSITLHHACHERAQNMGAKSAEMLRMIPGAKVDLVERCSGHGGTFGVMKKTRASAVKTGKPTARQIVQKGGETLCSDCPLACQHLGELVQAELPAGSVQPAQAHPIEVFARAYGLA
ncbi:MAG: hypothetical protein Q8M88_10475 [Phenylobacterium sp.]|uniref:(Fe-S)-binding protein n=1 Tax=Phenylobacterium sp. TaxID=1871053 RepID=UPI0027366A76|nr:hypothetical protein [Phenylobacterium sp.]MDP3174846.1 hypothetical protein [Phenylobacterium sp.]